MPTATFRWSPDREPHRARTQALLKAHPDLRRFIGRNPATGILIVLVVAAQLALAYALRADPWWVVIAASWLLGAFADHALFVMVHECAHDLVFKRRWANCVAALVANLPQFFPSAISFRHYHLKHHAFQGVQDLDADLPSEWEARLVHNRVLGKAAWMLLFPLFQIARTFRLREIEFFDGWVVLNWTLQIAFNAAVWVVLGPKAFVYLATSLFFSIGLHPLGARWIQEHYLTEGDQETYSYYGPLNAIAMNVGHHNEHHDLPSVPWQHLPAVRREAPEFYDTLHSHRSWSALMARFVFDPKISLFSRMTRARYDGAAASAVSDRSPSTPAT
ncbi:MAG TPA: fatty acid desaturase [Gemmatimonadaceae bacterium]|jgi:sphingolipid delta-4 desaturase